jgi:hypothetical protein
MDKFDIQELMDKVQELDNYFDNHGLERSNSIEFESDQGTYNVTITISSPYRDDNDDD